MFTSNIKIHINLLSSATNTTKSAHECREMPFQSHINKHRHHFLLSYLFWPILASSFATFSDFAVLSVPSLSPVKQRIDFKRARPWGRSREPLLGSFRLDDGFSRQQDGLSWITKLKCTFQAKDPHGWHILSTRRGIYFLIYGKHT